jgi:hypothetical protein
MGFVQEMSCAEYFRVINASSSLYSTESKHMNGGVEARNGGGGVDERGDGKLQACSNNGTIKKTHPYVCLPESKNRRLPRVLFRVLPSGNSHGYGDQSGLEPAGVKVCCR